MTEEHTVAEARPEPEIDPDERRAIVLLVGVAATVAFVILRVVVALGGHEPLPLDEWWHGFMGDMQSEILLAFAWFPADVGGTIGAPIMGLVIIGLFCLRRRWWDAINVAAAIVVVVAIGAPMAYVIARVRPSDSLAESVPTSFPSGHTAVATTIALTLALLLRRWYVWLIGAVWVVWMMWSRTYLHAHWASDVIAGLLEGIAVASLVWCAIEALRDRRARRKAGPPADHDGEWPEP